MSIQTLKQNMPDYAKDIKLNVAQVLTEEGAPDLTPVQITSIALACAYSTKLPALIQALQTDASAVLSPEQQQACKAAASIMAMNNIYYRFVHLSSDKSYAQMPANLRMNIMANPGTDKIDFELMSLAISAINGCGMCIDAHVNVLKKAGITLQAIQSSIRIASVMHATAQVLSMQAVA